VTRIEIKNPITKTNETLEALNNNEKYIER